MPKQYKNILCAVDFSEYSQEALDEALGLAAISKGRVTLVHTVSDPWSKVYNCDPEKLLDPLEAMKRAEQMLRDFAEKYAQGQECDFYVNRNEHVYRGIIGYARSFDSDIIVMATKGRTGSKRVLLGSVAENVIRHTPCAVLVVNPSQKDDATA